MTKPDQGLLTHMSNSIAVDQADNEWRYSNVSGDTRVVPTTDITDQCLEDK